MCDTKSPVRRAWLFTTHCPETIYSDYNAILDTDTLIAIDGGLEFLDRLGLAPDLILGDFDSLTDLSLLQKYPSAQLLRYPSAKNETDTELAVIWCVENGIDEAIICNDLEGRKDHALAIVQNLLYAHKHGLQARLESGAGIGLFIRENQVLPYPVGSLLSLISWSETALIRDSSGLEYSLANLRLQNHESRGISNRITSNPAQINLQNGLLFCLITIF